VGAKRIRQIRVQVMKAATAGLTLSIFSMAA
jgi:hypothetical protein